MGVMMGGRSPGKNPIIPVTAADSFVPLETAEFANPAVPHPQNPAVPHPHNESEHEKSA
jgi:hypothetical protein